MESTNKQNDQISHLTRELEQLKQKYASLELVVQHEAKTLHIQTWTNLGDFHALPLDVLLHLTTNYLPLATISTLSRTSKDWYRLLSHNDFWMKRYFVDYEPYHNSWKTLYQKRNPILEIRGQKKLVDSRLLITFNNPKTTDPFQFKEWLAFRELPQLRQGFSISFAFKLKFLAMDHGETIWSLGDHFENFLHLFLNPKNQVSLSIRNQLAKEMFQLDERWHSYHISYCANTGALTVRIDSKWDTELKVTPDYFDNVRLDLHFLGAHTWSGGGSRSARIAGSYYNVQVSFDPTVRHSVQIPKALEEF